MVHHSDRGVRYLAIHYPERLADAGAQWVDRYNQRRLHSSIGNLPPAEYEAAYYAERDGSAVA